MTKKYNYQELKDIVYNFKTKHDSGFTREEQLRLCDQIGISKPQYLDKLGTNTCLLIGQEVITYRHDVLKAIQCVEENRNLKSWEWD